MGTTTRIPLLTLCLLLVPALAGCSLWVEDRLDESGFANSFGVPPNGFGADATGFGGCLGGQRVECECPTGVGFQTCDAEGFVAGCLCPPGNASGPAIPPSRPPTSALDAGPSSVPDVDAGRPGTQPVPEGDLDAGEDLDDSGLE